MLDISFRLKLLVLFASLSLGNPSCVGEAPVVAQSSPPPTQVNPEFSRVYIFVDKSGAVGHSHAIEGKIQQGNLSLRPGSTGQLVFDMMSFDADTPRARQYLGLEASTDEATKSKVNANMLGDEVLDVKKFPQARLENVTIESKTSRSRRDLPEYVLSGDFSLRGKTRHVEALCDLEFKDGWHHLRGNFKIRQSDFAMKPFSKMFGAIGVADELVIHGDLWIVPE